MKILYINIIVAACFVLLAGSCSKEDEPSPGVGASGVRLAYFTEASGVSEAFSEHLTGYTLLDSSFTDIGKYPKLPHVYYYEVSWERELNNFVTLRRYIDSQAGMGDETKDEVLETHSDYVEIHDQRLDDLPYTNVFALKYLDNKKDYWRFELYIQLEHINQDNQVITFSGDFVSAVNGQEDIVPEPPGDAEAISAMLSLVEPMEP